MKANKSPDGTEVTPSKKKLKQARLPFMLISDVSPKADAPQGRKRKLSVPDVEPVTKVGKVSKENDLTEDIVLISDDDSKEVSNSQKKDKPLNPYVKLVDTAWKKKMQKGKTPKKASNKNDSSPETNSTTSKKAKITTKNLLEKSNEISSTKSESLQKTKTISKSKKSPNKPSSTITSPSAKPLHIDSEVISDDGSNNASDANKLQSKMTKDSEDPEHSSDIEHGETLENEQITDDNIVTPKRSIRNSAKLKETNSNTSIISTASSKLDESMSSAPGTPKQNNISANLDESMNDSIANLSNVSASNLTPKQVSSLLI